MKKFTYIGIVFLSLFLVSCQKEFLDTKPTADVDAESAFKSLNNAYAVINGIHRYMYAGGDLQDQSGEGSVNIRRDMLGEDLCMTAAGNGWFNRVYQWTDHRNALADATNYPWIFYYRIIGNANAVIDALDTKLVAQKDDPQYQMILAQALTYRAWAHFSLVQLFAKRYDETKKGSNTQLGVVLSTSSEVKQRPRATVEEIYTQVNKDLDDAITLFTSADLDPNQVSDLSLHAAEAIKARVALTTGQWQTAINFSTKALAAGKLFTTADFKSNGGFTSIFSIYPGPGFEWIWGSQVKSDQNTYFNAFGAYMSWNYSSTNVRGNPKTITKELYDAMPAGDSRKAMYSLNGYDIKAKPSSQLDSRALVASYQSKKFSAVNPADSRSDIAYIRVAEMYLIKAEAEARIGGKEADAQQTLFALLTTRIDSYVKTTNTGQDLIDEILLQRRIELWGEGFRFTDLKRLNQPLVRSTSAVVDPALPYQSGHIKTSYAGHHDAALCVTTNVPAGDVKWQWFIPKKEIDANSLVVQND